MDFGACASERHVQARWPVSGAGAQWVAEETAAPIDQGASSAKCADAGRQGVESAENEGVI